MINTNLNEIRGVTIAVSNGRVLMPNATVSEVITFSAPKTIENAPAWVLGTITWRGWRVPLFSFARLSGHEEEEGTAGAKVAIIKALSCEPRMPFMAMLAQGFPRLTTISMQTLSLSADEEETPDGVEAFVMVNEDEAFVPDLDEIERRLLEIA